MAIPVVDPAILSFDVYAGSTWTPDTIVWEHDGTPVNLTGCTARLMARNEYPDASPLIDIDTAGGIVLGGAAGEITLSLTAVETAALGVTLAHTVTQLVYDLEIVDGATVVQLVRGIITIYPEATR